MRAKRLISVIAEGPAQALPPPPPAIHQKAEVSKPSSITPEFIHYIKSVENPDMIGYDRKSGRWYPHRDPSKGINVGYGHQLAPQEIARVKQQGLTTQEVEALLIQDLTAAREKVHGYIRRKYHVNLQLTQKQEQMLMDYAFNLGSLRAFPLMVDAVLQHDQQGMTREYKRSGVIAGKRQELTKRNKAFANFAGITERRLVYT